MDWITTVLFWAELKDKILGPFAGVRESIDLLFLAFKIVVLLFLVSFVRNRFGAGPIVTVLLLVLGYIILFQYWMFFGPMMFIYLIIVFGFSAILVDVAITKPWQDPNAMMGEGHDMSFGEIRHMEKKMAGASMRMGGHR